MVTELSPDVAARGIVFAVGLLSLFAAHQIGDHVLQTDRQATAKAGRGRAGLRAMVGHLVAYHLTAAALLVGTGAVLGLPLSTRGLLAALGFSAITHGLLDRRWPVRAILRATGAAEFAESTAPVCGMYVADQALHQLALLISALLLAAL